MRTATRHHRATPGTVIVRLARHQDVWGMVPRRYALPEMVVHCSLCGRPAVQVDADWPASDEGTRCGDHLEVRG